MFHSDSDTLTPGGYQHCFASIPENEQIFIRDMIHHEEALQIEKSILEVKEALKKIWVEKKDAEIENFLRSSKTDNAVDGYWLQFHMLEKEMRDIIVEILECIRGNIPNIPSFETFNFHHWNSLTATWIAEIIQILIVPQLPNEDNWFGESIPLEYISGLFLTQLFEKYLIYLQDDEITFEVREKISEITRILEFLNTAETLVS